MDRTDTDVLTEKSLEDVIQGYIIGKYNFTELKMYRDWNEFNLSDIDFNKIYKARLAMMLKRRLQ